MSDIDKRLNKILEKVFSYGVGTNSEDIIGNDTAFLNIEEHALETGKQAIKQLMVDEFEKLIGDMEYRETFDMGLSSWSNEDYKAFGRNELRAELRQKLEEWK